PCCLSASLRRRIDAVPLQDIRNCFVRQHVTKIRERSLDPSTTPATILLSHAYDEDGNVLQCSRPARRSKWRAVVLLRNQSAVPGPTRFWSDDLSKTGHESLT